MTDVIGRIDLSSKETIQSNSLNAAEIFAQAAPSVVRVNNGSGVFVSSGTAHSCEIVTQTHVANDATADVVAADGISYKASLLLIDPVHELSFYKLEGVLDSAKVCKEIQIYAGELAVGQHVIAIGARGDDGATAEKPNFHESTIKRAWTRRMAYADNFIDRWSHQQPESADSPLLSTSERLTRKGYSGGPWLDANGQLVGITWGDTAWSSFADPGKFVQQGLDRIRAGVPASQAPVKKPQGFLSNIWRLLT
ncbi:MAG TPA: serine protease [Oculatellaceae cyanobacterium]